MDKRRAVKNMVDRLGRHVAPSRVAEALRQYDIEVSENFVAKVKLQMDRQDAKAAQQRAKRPPKNKSRNRPQQRKVPQRRK